VCKLFVEVQQSTIVDSFQGHRHILCHSIFPTIPSTFGWTNNWYNPYFQMCITLHANVSFIIDIGDSSGYFPPLEHARLVGNSLVGDFTGLLWYTLS